MRIKVSVALLLAVVAFFFSCRKQTVQEEPYIQTPISLAIPPYFPKMKIPEDNPMTKERLALGRKLYYDPILSNNGKSCSSCHYQEQGFTTDVMLSGTPVLPHVNLGWSKNFLWKGEKHYTLEEMMLYEVNEFFYTDLSKINANNEYKKLFKQAFGVSYISSKEIAYSLAQFFRSLISGNSKFDKYRRREVAFTSEEQRGMEIFFTEKGDCFHCHGIMLFTDNLFHNNGLDSVFINSKGRFDFTGLASDIGLYKTPTLRNAELRKNFMHDGRFKTLEEVIEFYNSGVQQQSPNIDPLMVLPQKEFGLQLTEQDKYDLLQFLRTLTDTSFTNNPEFSKPN